MWIRFIIYGLAGWLLEIIWTGSVAGFNGDIKLESNTYLWMFPIYGCAVFLEPVHNYIRQWSFWLRGIVWVMLIWSIEYITGGIIFLLTGSIPWDYSQSNGFHLHGLIRFDMAPLWFITGFIFERVHDFLRKAISNV